MYGTEMPANCSSKAGRFVYKPLVIVGSHGKQYGSCVATVTSRQYWPLCDAIRIS